MDYFKNFIKYRKTKSKISEYSIGLLEKNVNSFISFLTKKPQANNILFYGEVQSGKTDNIIGSVLKLADSSFEIFVLFTSNMMDLHSQTVERFFDEFKKIDDTNNFEFIKDIEGIKSAKILSFSGGPKRIYVISCMKQLDWLNALTMLFASNRENLSNFNQKHIFFFDDEADWGASSTLEDDEINMTLNNLLRMLEIKMGMKTHYIPITATPYYLLENLENQREFLEINKILLLDNNKNEKLNNESSRKYHGLDWQISNENLFIEIEKEWEESISIGFSIYQFIINHILSVENDWSLMLINTELETSKQTNIRKKIISFFENESKVLIDFKKSIELVDYLRIKFSSKLIHIEEIQNSDSYFSKIKELIMRYYYLVNINEAFATKHIMVLNSSSETKTNDIDDLMRINMKSTQILINSESKYFQNNQIFFIVGGHKISRGITFPKLKVELLLNNSDKPDTLLQRARWFGYKTIEESKWVNVVTTKEINDNFRNKIFPLDESFRKAIADDGSISNDTIQQISKKFK